MILIVGLNENNNSICYHDPATSLFGYPECGTYAWMDISQFRDGMDKLLKISNSAFRLCIFQDNNSTPFNNNKIFELAHNRNIEKMKGNLSVYDSFITNYLRCTKLGILGLKSLKEDFEVGIGNRISTILTYKMLIARYYLSIGYKMYLTFEKLFPDLMSINDYESEINYYYQIFLEKYNISQYLLEKVSLDNETISNICRKDSYLLRCESENFSSLASCYSKFLKKGCLMTISEGIILMQEMSEIISNLILLEQKIINNEN